LDGGKSPDRLLILLDNAGTGKTTLARRVGYDLCRDGYLIFNCQAIARLDVAGVMKILGQLSRRCIVIIDGLADQADQVRELLETSSDRNFLILGSERAYRKDFIDLVLTGTDFEYIYPNPFNENEFSQLIERYRQQGLVGDPSAVRQPNRFARQILHDPISVAVCRILHDFRPLDDIVFSLWEAADPAARIRYLACALARYCYPVGLQYSLVQALDSSEISDQLTAAHPLALVWTDSESDYLVPGNSSIGDRVLTMARQRDREFLFEIFCKIADYIAPYVNRRTIMQRSPEARLAGRLFDYDKVVEPWLGDKAREFYVMTQPKWEWNSRYWEQRALLMQRDDPELALQYARHAAAIERHPFTLTTLSKILLDSLDYSTTNRRTIFDEVFSNLDTAIKMEIIRSRISMHPYLTLLSGTAKFLEMGGTLSNHQRQLIRRYLDDATHRFRNDPGVFNAALRCEQWL
jgi:hypothetical protein